VSQEEVVAVLKKCIDNGDMQNLLFYGPPGTGKTSAAVALCHQLFKENSVYKDRVLELNASDERGIDIVRSRIKEFARRAVGRVGAKEGVIQIRVVILDEADAMTSAAQAALRRTMESETATTRFFLICNYITRIIEPLASRCAKFRFKPLSVDAQLDRLHYICQKEGVMVEDQAVKELVAITEGDLRKSITILQSLACSGEMVSVEDVHEMSGLVPSHSIDKLLVAAQRGKLERQLKAVKRLGKNGYGAYQVVKQISEVILSNEVLQPAHKAKIFEKLADCEKRLLDGADEFLQLLDIMMLVHKCFSEVEYGPQGMEVGGD